ncbi:hypothetical protein BO78DRAFT_216967 [Aspergillus sclerotiicarbonarius CBS 121057]|uniref:Uncharacterized protein n=1 Tax=Aspergillus sclerotiicarbonarius (strain CBS 121057 / IBT 28362) TaxID=1448318 RepID=A0A319DXQ8_ASPSB|nr:hypothetical protein BO78DRAFT_216967 [Aspergillus sclerotiicarbonarius CBS 121057]
MWRRRCPFAAPERKTPSSVLPPSSRRPLFGFIPFFLHVFYSLALLDQTAYITIALPSSSPRPPDRVSEYSARIAVVA